MLQRQEKVESVCRAVLFIISFIIRFPILTEARYSLREERSADFPTQDLVAEVQNNGMATNYAFFFFFFISPISINRVFQKYTVFNVS